jgi:hypothetical protein
LSFISPTHTDKSMPQDISAESREIPSWIERI